MGIQTELVIEKISTQRHRDREFLRQDYGYRTQLREDTAIDDDWNISGLSEMLDAPMLDLSKLVWRTLSETPPSVLTARFRPNRQYHIREYPSTLVYLLREKCWVPQKDGSFVKPSQASSGQLPRGFPFDEGYEWLKAIGFGEDEKKQSEEFHHREKKRIELGFKSEDSLIRAQEFVNLFPEEEQKRILSEQKQRRDFELPENSVSNPQRRAQKLAEQAKNAPERISEERTRSVSVGVEEVKAKADQYLRQQYTNIDGQMICQVCKAELPFKKDNGDYYFERVELLEDLPGRHRENYLVLCPNHAAMFQHANGSKGLLEPMLKELEGTELEVVLAQRDMTVYFTETHITDLKAVISSVRRQEDNPEVRP